MTPVGQRGHDCGHGPGPGFHRPDPAVPLRADGGLEGNAPAPGLGPIRNTTNRHLLQNTATVCPGRPTIPTSEPGAVTGTISRRISQRGQFFPQFLRGQLEELPEAQVGQLQAQQAVRRLTLAAAGPEPTQVPVQPLQVQ